MGLTMTDLPEWMSPREFAEHLRVSLRHVEQLVADGKLRHVKLGRSVRIPTSEIERLARGPRDPDATVPDANP